MGQTVMNGNFRQGQQGHKQTKINVQRDDRLFWENVPNPVDIKRECLRG